MLENIGSNNSKVNISQHLQQCLTDDHWYMIPRFKSLIHMLVQRFYKHDEYSVITKCNCVCAHLTSPISGCFSFCFTSSSVRYRPTRSAFPWRSSFTITSSTARPMAHDTGLPPNWEIQNPHTEERLHRGWLHTASEISHPNIRTTDWSEALST